MLTYAGAFSTFTLEMSKTVWVKSIILDRECTFRSVGLKQNGREQDTKARSNIPVLGRREKRFGRGK